jgi:acyl-CoA reductase-like NAD-dependent aldehyde dehydrogenase
MQDILTALGLSEINDGCSAGPASGELIESRSPTTGEVIAKVRLATREDYERTVVAAQDAFTRFRTLPAPKRGEIVRQLGEAMRELKDPLGKLISLEMGKIYQEGLGEVQEAIDMAEFCVGLSRQLYGLTMHSERPGHRMYEQWHPLGVIGIITAFNFPCAVWAWNALVAAVCGDTMIWKPSLETPLIAVACQKICDRVLAEHGLEGAMGLCVCDHETSVAMTEDRRLPLISATGSCRMGREVGKVVAGRLARCLLELGGNNAIIVMDDADLDLAVRGVLFGAVGTAGQRCTSTRRVLLHKDIAETFTERLLKAYTQVRIGDPLAEGTLMGGRPGDPGRARQGPLRHPGDRQSPQGPAHDAGGGVRADPLPRRDRQPRGGHRAPERRPAGPQLSGLHREHAVRRTLPVTGRQRLRHRQRQHRHLGRRDRRGLRRRERHRRRPRGRQRRLEGLHAPPDVHDQLLRRAAARAGDHVRVTERPDSRSPAKKKGAEPKLRALRCERMRLSRERLRTPPEARPRRHNQAT